MLVRLDTLTPSLAVRGAECLLESFFSEIYGISVVVIAGCHSSASTDTSRVSFGVSNLVGEVFSVQFSEVLSREIQFLDVARMFRAGSAFYFDLKARGLAICHPRSIGSGRNFHIYNRDNDKLIFHASVWAGGSMCLLDEEEVSQGYLGERFRELRGQDDK